MFKLATDMEIGAYLRERIGQSEDFRSQRDFCRKYLELRGDAVTEEALTNMANRLSQMLKGRKGIQISDLPIFTRLLDTTCEQLLSAGRVSVPEGDRLTNHGVAASDDPAVWQAYAERPDRPILRADEYNKTLLDYAVDFNNYELLRFLVEKKYIWFYQENGRGPEPYSFAVRTSIQPRLPDWQDALSYSPEESGLRSKVIALAAERGDVAMLEEMRARVAPDMTLRSNPFFVAPEIRKYYDERQTRRLAEAGRDVIAYFSEPYTTHGIDDPIETTWRYPFLGQLIGFLVAGNSPHAELALQAALEHNRWALEQLKDRMEETERVYGPDLPRYVEIEEDGLVLRYWMLPCHKEMGFMTDIFRVDVPRQANSRFGPLIRKVNEVYEQILAIVDQAK